MSLNKVFDQFEEFFYTPHFVRKTTNTTQLLVQDRAKGMKLLKNDSFALSKEKVSNSHVSFILDLSQDSFWDRRALNKLRKMDSVFFPKTYISKVESAFILEDPKRLPKALKIKLTRMLGSDKKELIENILTPNKTFYYKFLYSLLGSIQKQAFKNPSKQPTLLISNQLVKEQQGFLTRHEKAYLTLKEEAPKVDIKDILDEKSYAFSLREKIEIICKEMMINLVYYSESPNFSPCLEFIQFNWVENEEKDKFLYSLFQKENPSISDKKEPSYRLLKNKIKKTLQNPLNLKLIETDNWKTVFQNKRVHQAVLKSSISNEYISHLLSQGLISKKDFLGLVKKEQKVQTWDEFRLIKSVNPNAEITCIEPYGTTPTIEMFKTKNIDFFQYCIKEGFYIGEKDNPDHIDLINHLLVYKEKNKIKILRNHNIFFLNEPDSDGDTSLSVINYILKKNSSKYSDEYKEFLNQIIYSEKIKESA